MVSLKGGKYIVLGALIAATSGSYAKSAEPPKCTSELESKITELRIDVDLADYSMRLDGIIGDQRCRFFQQKIIVGKKGWPTPKMETEVQYAVTNPRWYPSKNILKELEKERTKEYMEETFYHSKPPYMKPGKDNPLGKLKLKLKKNSEILIHGTPHKHLFKKKKRRFSYGCIRVEDEVKLVSTLSRVAGKRKLNLEKTQWLRFNKPITVKIR